jgi:hypothetical protein
MPPLRTLLLAALAASLPALAGAHVGDLRADFEKRYGAGKEVGDQVLFTVDGFTATVFFDAKSRATMTIYAPRRGNDGAVPPLTPADIETLLHEEGQGKEWRKFQGTAQPTWLRLDNQLFARLREDENILIFVNPAYTPTAPDLVPVPPPRKGP